jgi:type IV secretory pathway TrbD component
MNKTRVPFPRYLNAKKLIFRWEYDLVLVSVLSFVLAMVVQVWVAIPLPIAMGGAFAISYYVMKKYEKHFKKIRKGYNSHLFYSFGYLEPLDRTKIKESYEEYLIPRGFENSFKD